jgi:hypothetical protein
MPGSSSTSPAGAVTAMPDGRIRQHGDPNPDLNSSPAGEPFELQSGDEDAEVRRIISDQHTQPSTEFRSDRVDLGTE